MAGSTAEYIGDLVFKLLGMNAARKREVAEYMSNIAETLSKFGPKVRGGGPPDELWGLAKETEDLADRFASATADVLPEQDRKAHTRRLQEAFNAKSLLAAGQDGEKEELLRTISQNAGAFRSAAASLKGAAGKLG